MQPGSDIEILFWERGGAEILETTPRYLISDVFYKVLKELETGGSFEGGLFRRIDFAVLDHTRGQYNFKEFCRNFSENNPYQENGE